MSPKSTSAMSPSETKCEKPMPRGVAQSRTEVMIAPDCVTKASSPGPRRRCAKLALRPMPRHQHAEAVGPDQAHAVFRPPWRAACSAAPAAAPPSPKPAVITTAARVPRRAERGDRPRAPFAGGVEMTARSGASAASGSGRPGRPVDGAVVRIDRHDRALEAAADQVGISTAPTEPRRACSRRRRRPRPG